jgi:ribosomal protein L1
MERGTRNIHIGHVNQTEEEIEENITSALQLLAKRLKGWRNIKSIHLKTDTSIALPLYSQEKYRPHPGMIVPPTVSGSAE